jgi:succinate-semialdehyde dehydrogenase/glutarate-semialdehyde dehydrogenase
MYRTIDPKTGELVEEFPYTTDHDADVALFHAVSAQAEWALTSFEHRAELFEAMGDHLEDFAAMYADVLTLEMGKPLSQARAEVEKCAWVCRYFAHHAAEFLADQPVETDASRSWVQFDPLGVVLAVMPWNYPFWQFFRFAAPALMAGNATILKHASNVPRCSTAIVDAFRQVGFPDYLVQHLFLDNDATSELIADPRIAAVTLTGSVRAGRSVGEAAGRALKPVVLELGGSDPFIVLSDADLDKVIDLAVLGRTQNNGQTCIAAKRFIVEESVYAAFVERYTQALDALVMGDPTDPDTDLGPLAREDLRDELHDQVMRTVKAGAVLRLGGRVPDKRGWYYPATLLLDVKPGMAAFDEETFGPVAAVTKAHDLEHALELANHSDFGLGGTLWTERDDIEPIVSRMEVGAVAVNGITKSDPRLPFGGVKHSGFGRELSAFGIREFVNIKSVWVG